MLKAESLFNLFSRITPGKRITWPIYDGKDPLEAKTVENYVTPFFKTGSNASVENGTTQIASTP